MGPFGSAGRTDLGPWQLGDQGSGRYQVAKQEKKCRPETEPNLGHFQIPCERVVKLGRTEARPRQFYWDMELEKIRVHRTSLLTVNGGLEQTFLIRAVLADVILDTNFASRVITAHVPDFSKNFAFTPGPIVSAQHPKNAAVGIWVAAVECPFVVQFNHCG